MQKRPHQNRLIPRARELRRSQTGAEEMLWSCLRNRQLRYAKFRRQHPIGPFITDFYCQNFRLAIELEGAVHDDPGQHKHDLGRLRALEATGIRVLAFKNEQIFQNLESVLDTIAKALIPNSGTA